MKSAVCMVLILFSFFLTSCNHLERKGLKDQVVMVWDLILEQEDNRTTKDVFDNINADVLAPTWFGLEWPAGAVYNLADLDYVEWAHRNGIAVWAVFENKSDQDLTYQVLSDDRLRNQAVEQIVNFAQRYDLDGINLDFEALDYRTGVWFEQLVRELYAELSALEVTMSVDIPLPIDILHELYDMQVIREYSDYIVIMAYDEHYDEHLEIGPVASVNWMDEGIAEALNHFEGEEIIMGVPFYTRIWIEDCTGDTAVMRSEVMGIAKAWELFEQQSNVWYREPDTGQIYAEIEEHNIFYKAWLEDGHSFSDKFDIIDKYNLGGLAAWHLGMESKETWELIGRYFEK